MQGNDGAAFDKHRIFIQGKRFAKGLIALIDFTVIEKIVPCAFGKGHGMVEGVRIDRCDQQIVSEQIVIFAIRRALQRLTAIVALHHMAVHIVDQFGMQPRELADDLQLLPAAFPQGAFAVPAVGGVADSAWYPPQSH